MRFATGKSGKKLDKKGYEEEPFAPGGELVQLQEWIVNQA